ncbi:MAG TPA: polysaccharide biosynthesis/export family protein [Chitinophagaceae bacterium]|nr:polysaccharide biosynthesis/export family protein [Chitinophagaceae bacterium]
MNDFKATLMNCRQFLLPLAGLAFFLSCTAPKHLPQYLENVVDTSRTDRVQFPELTIQKNDLLSIQVYSLSTDPKVDELYNLRPSAAGAVGTTSQLMTGFLVDANGNIEYPRLGIIRAEGLTKQQLADEIKRRLTEPVELLRNPSVIIRFMNYRVLVMGEVTAPGQVTTQGERLTILEAIALAGGIPTTGKKNEVRVIREINGVREIGVVDLSSKQLFASPYYNLMQNDIILVEPTKRKLSTEEQNVVAQRVSFALSLITAAAFIYNIFSHQ